MLTRLDHQNLILQTEHFLFITSCFQYKDKIVLIAKFRREMSVKFSFQYININD